MRAGVRVRSRGWLQGPCLLQRADERRWNHLLHCSSYSGSAAGDTDGTAAQSPLAASGLGRELSGEKRGSSCPRGQDMGSPWLTLTLPALGPFPVSPLGTSWSLERPQPHGQDAARGRGWGQGQLDPAALGHVPVEQLSPSAAGDRAVARPPLRGAGARRAPAHPCPPPVMVFAASVTDTQGLNCSNLCNLLSEIKTSPHPQTLSFSFQDSLAVITAGGSHLAFKHCSILLKNAFQNQMSLCSMARAGCSGWVRGSELGPK